MPSSRATAVTVLPEESTSATASRLNSSVYRFVYLLPTWCYFLWNHSSPSLQVSTIKGKLQFTPIPKRWTVERTYGWLMLHRRLARDYETLPARSKAMIHLAMTDLMSRRLTGEATISWRDPTSRDEIRITG